MARTLKPTVAGILCIVSGLLGVISVPLLFFIGAMSELPRLLILIFFVLLPLILAILAMVGGYFALWSRRIRWALAGSITSILTPGFPLGIVALILLALSKSEFNGEPTD